MKNNTVEPKVCPHCGKPWGQCPHTVSVSVSETDTGAIRVQTATTPASPPELQNYWSGREEGPGYERGGGYDDQ